MTERNDELNQRTDALLQARLDGTITPDEARELEALLHADAGAMERARAFDRLASLSRAARHADRTGAPLGFSAAVMRRINAAPAEASPLQRFFAPTWFRLASGIAVAGMALWLAHLAVSPKPLPVEPGTQSVDQPVAEVVSHRFELSAPGAKRVCLVGDFNGWQVCEAPLVHDPAAGTWSVELKIPPGRHEYMFVVDSGWVTDPGADLHVDDGFGNRNAVIFL